MKDTNKWNSSGLTSDFRCLAKNILSCSSTALLQDSFDNTGNMKQKDSKNKYIQTYTSKTDTSPLSKTDTSPLSKTDVSQRQTPLKELDGNASISKNKTYRKERLERWMVHWIRNERKCIVRKKFCGLTEWCTFCLQIILKVFHSFFSFLELKRNLHLWQKMQEWWQCTLV